jgi:hypothetical protein
VVVGSLVLLLVVGQPQQLWEWEEEWEEECILRCFFEARIGGVKPTFLLLVREVWCGR